MTLKSTGDKARFRRPLQTLMGITDQVVSMLFAQLAAIAFVLTDPVEHITGVDGN